MNNSYSKLINITVVSIMSAGCYGLLATKAAVAQTSPKVAQYLPSPPPLSPRSRIIRGNRINRGRKNNILPLPNIEPPISNQIAKEYTFKAPSIAQSYRVEVLGNNQQTLQQVRNIEPQAFVKGNIIQVGIFQDKDNAATLVQELALKGLWARIANH